MEYSPQTRWKIMSQMPIPLLQEILFTLENILANFYEEFF
jgi:hypothetical protein